MKNKKSTLARVLTLTLALTMLCTVNALAVEYQSGEDSHEVGDYTYQVYSSLYIDGDTECRAGTWMYTDGYVNVPANYMGAKAILYQEDGSVIYGTSQFEYNSTSSYFWYRVTPTQTHSGRVYSEGVVRIYSGTRYEEYTAPETLHVISNRATSELTDTLMATLDENGNYPMNANGETYGSGLLAKIVGAEPDLIAAVGVDDVEGYIRADDWDIDVSNPEEAAAYMASLDGDRTIPLYDVNGTVIGTFILTSFDLEGVEDMSFEEARAAVENLQ